MKINKAFNTQKLIIFTSGCQIKGVTGETKENHSAADVDWMVIKIEKKAWNNWLTDWQGNFLGHSGAENDRTHCTHKVTSWSTQEYGKWTLVLVFLEKILIINLTHSWNGQTNGWNLWSIAPLGYKSQHKSLDKNCITKDW